MTTPTLRERIQQAQPMIGMFSVMGNIEVIELIGLAGFDFVVIDMEHGPLGIQAVVPLILAARSRQLTPIVRVRSNDPALIGSALDAGAAGVLVPQIDSAEAARALAAAARFAPEGQRGLNPWVRAADFLADEGWLARANASVGVTAMIEGRAGFAALPEILRVDGLDAIFLGPVDLAQSMGFGLQSEHPQVVQAVIEAVEAAREHGKAVAVFAPTAEAARRWLERGVAMVAVSEDTAVVGQALRKLRAELGDQ
jgi:4-hydroxy-2-oxoheptanedioate aldolase